MTFDLPMIWAGIIAFAVFAYVVLDGFDLGVGILFPFVRHDADRDQMMNSVAPVWDGNETWLVLGGGGLFAVFPLAFAIIMPALYVPITAMLVGLIFRGVAFEFRWKTVEGKYLWDWSFAGGSVLAAFAQGVALGALVQGIVVNGRAYGGGSWDWLTPFSITTGVAVIIGYALLGATWLIWKCENHVERRAYDSAFILAPLMLICVVGVSFWTPLLNEGYSRRWLEASQAHLNYAVPLAVLVASFYLLKGLTQRRQFMPFAAALALFALCFAGLGYSFYPDIIPARVSIWEAAAPDKSLAFLLVGSSILIPMILAYTGYSYWVFRGKVKGGYH